MLNFQSTSFDKKCQVKYDAKMPIGTFIDFFSAVLPI